MIRRKKYNESEFVLNVEKNRRDLEKLRQTLQTAVWIIKISQFLHPWKDFGNHKKNKVGGGGWKKSP